MKRFSLVVVLCALFVSFAFAVNAPIQDVYHFDIRQGLAPLNGYTVPVPFRNAPDNNFNALATSPRTVGRDLVELIELAVARNTDPIVSLGDPESGINNFQLGVNGVGSNVNWRADAGITPLELAVMAVKILGEEKQALSLYPLVSPTFTDIKPIPPAGLGNNRAFGYLEYYNNILIGNMKLPLMPLRNPNQVMNRLDVIEFVVRLAQVKYEADGYFDDVYDFVNPNLLTAMGINTKVKLSLVDFAEALNAHLATTYSFNNALVNANVGFAYAFEFFFLSEESANEVSPERNNPNELVNNKQLYVPVILLDEFRVYYSNRLRTYDSLGRFETNGTNGSNRNVWMGTAGTPLAAEKFWTVALLSKIFNTETKKVEKYNYAPKRELNNVVIYEQLNGFEGQIAFGDFKADEVIITEKPEIVRCQNIAYPGYLDPTKPMTTNPASPVNPELSYYIYDIGNEEVIVTDMTIWDDYSNAAISSLNGHNYAASYKKANLRTTTNKFVAYGVYDNDENESRLIQTRIFNNPVPKRPLAPTAAELALFPCEINLGLSEEIDAYKVFIPSANDFVDPGNLLVKNVQDILFKDQKSDYVQKVDTTAANLVDCEPVMFDVEFVHKPNENRVEFVYATDRLNHKEDILTLGGIREFVELYLGVTFDAIRNVYLDNGSKVIDRIDSLSVGTNFADTPMIAYYWHMYRALRGAGVADNAKIVSIVRTLPVDAIITFNKSNYRTAEQFYGELRALERFEVNPDQKLENLVAYDGVLVPQTAINSDYEVYPVIKEACVTIERDPDCGTGDAEINVCCPPENLVDDDFVALFDPYVNYQFVFPGDVKIAKFDKNQLFSGNVTVGPGALLRTIFGFEGLKVETLIVSRSINPEKPLLKDDDAILLKAYDEK